MMSIMESQTGWDQSSQPFPFFFDWNPQPMWVWDVKTLHFLAANEAAIRHYGYSRAEFLGMKFVEILTPKDSSSSSNNLLKSTSFDNPETCTCLRKDGTMIEVEIRGHLINWLGNPAQLVAAQDVTDRKSAQLALRDSEERVKLILTSAAEAIFGCDPVGTCMFCNHAAARALGYNDPAELVGKNMHATEHHTRADGTPYPLEECPIFQGFLKRQGVHRDDEIFWRKDGTSFPVEYWSHLMVQEGRTLCVVTFMDITERKRAEEALRKSEARNRTLLEINNAIIINLNQESLLHAIASALRRVIPFDRAAFVLYDQNRQMFRYLAIEGTLASAHFRPGLEFGRGDTISAWVFDHQRPALRHDLEKEQQYPNDRRLVNEGFNSDCIVPVIIGGKSIGTLNLASKNIGQYSETHVEFLCELGSQVALAVSNMMSYEEIAALKTKVERTAERYRTLLEINNAIITNLTREALFQSVSVALHHVIDFDRSALTLYDPVTDGLRFVAFTGSPLRFRIGDELKRADSSAGWVFDHQQPVVRGNLEKEQQYPNERQLIDEDMRSHCVVPLIARGESIGTINISSKKEFLYSEMDAQFLQEVANQVALAIENMKSYEEIAKLKATLEKENVYLQEEIRTGHNFEEIVGDSPALLAALRKVEQVAPTDSTVLIFGETGTGKELIARAIHDRSGRKTRPLVKVNCSAISAGLVESELFGHVKGAFTGALDRRIGRFELADGGTIFLDEIGELPLETQVKLLRVLQEHEFEPVGSSRPLRVNVRVIAATNRNLEEAIQAGRFRSDLFYRLNVFPLEMPPLRERRSDIPKLAKFFLSNCSKKLGKNIDGISHDTMDRILGYSWPGNVRELQNVIERAVILSPGRILELLYELTPNRIVGDSLGSADRPTAQALPVDLQASTLSTMKEVERSHILAALKQTSGVIEGPKGAARILNMHPNTLRHRMEKFGIKRSDHHPS
jgi:formate hydrogenlyase transcriptional activator